jgi:hypothetical protein
MAELAANGGVGGSAVCGNFRGVDVGRAAAKARTRSDRSDSHDTRVNGRRNTGGGQSRKDCGIQSEVGGDVEDTERNSRNA